MRKALVFVAAFALVLVAGAAVAFMATPDEEVATEPPAVEKPTTTSTSVKEIKDPPEKEEVEEEKHEEEPPKKEDEKPKEEVKEEKDTTPPEITILFPENGQHFNERTVGFEGWTDDPTARVFAGKYEADVDAEGNWRIVLKLTHDGANHATFKAVDKAGNEGKASVEAYYDAPEKEKAEEEPQKDKDHKEYDFTAHQKYGSCGEDVPYDKWHGTGTSGTKVWIGNDWGSGSTTVGEDGKWFLKVKFPEMPCGTHKVVLETNDGDRKVYEFTRICNEGGGDGDHGDK